MNRRGQIVGEGMFLLWRLILISMLVLFVSLTVGVAFASKQDVRPMEASILYEKVSKCIAKGGIANSEFSLDGCFMDDNQLYVNVNVTSFDGQFSREVQSGDPSLKVWFNPELAKQLASEKRPYLMTQRSYVLISNQGKLSKGIMEVLIGIKKYGENI